MTKYILSLSSLLLLLTACGGNSPQEGVSPPPSETVHTGGLISSGASTSVNTPKTTNYRNMDSMENIENIASIDDLKKINPFVDSLPGKDHPKFLELQKDQLKLGLLMSKIQEKEYLALLDSQKSILQCREVWTEDIKNIDRRFQEALLKRQSGSGTLQDDFRTLLDTKNTMMHDFQSSKDCREYIQSNQAKLKEISDAMKKYYTPEILELQKSIESLNVEIYSSNSRIDTSRVGSGQTNNSQTK